MTKFIQLTSEQFDQLQGLIEKILLNYRPAIAEQVYGEFLNAYGHEILALKEHTRGLGRIPSTRLIWKIQELEKVLEDLKKVALETQEE